MSLDLVSLTRPYRPTSSHHHARRPLLPMQTWLNIAIITETTATPQRNVKHSKIKLKNWFVLVISAASSAETTTLPNPITLLVLTTDALPATFATTNAQANLQTTTPNRLAPMSPLLTLPYAALLTPSLVALLVADPPHPPERDTSNISHPSTTLPILITNVACPL